MDKEGRYYITAKNQGKITLNINISNNRIEIYESKTDRTEGKIDKSIIIVRNVNALLKII